MVFWGLPATAREYLPVLYGNKEIDRITMFSLADGSEFVALPGAGK
jgi:hypothetical protein